MILADTVWYEWYYDLLQPWVHYVPVKRDFSDLAKKVEWLRANDDKARWINEQASLFVKNYLRTYQSRDWIMRNFKLFEKAYHNPTIRTTT